ncbi:hypothetical protein Spith_1016 [Spirochaeta thermophila DSM 6578]|uniref:Outer membrane protein beta-barrel domain-containing protein n=1 Tax=Winmispira thermophila (strain ATCC 700085 / DSM 6578 / Z-1203) TaxID=869211 RepID=G0GCZ6_WINT7|nr:hypothetical protein [Spirochaeta thermophila]AEJ61288.1 hypothetical protein Spith_1016 [Spirochaeta thermophila DSM 6578]
MKSRIRRRVWAGLLFSLFILQWTGAQELPTKEPGARPRPTYGLGDQSLSLSAGVLLPLFFQFTEDFRTAPTNLSLGGTASLKWSGYLSDATRLGFDFGGMFAFSPNSRALYMVPFLFTFDYIVYAFPFEVPLHASVGPCFTQLEELFHIDPMLKIGATILWDYDPAWSFGMNLHYWWIMQLYTSNPDTPPPSHSAFGNFLEISLVAEYRIR